ncbi:AfsR/SARP family transcriptional regulator [Streptomyces sp. 769]|uniref:AfsR/SARP family transcriptional regulator n=1 Tax=Streptomyces sp. 769 TaxID=1262452 RepID=UPI0005806D91|nr:AfsR/SARP family transcriptional regulator [Streptomyces sp. 769]
MRFNLLGPFEIRTDDGRTYAPKAPKISQLLALLALRPREAVAVDVLARELWGQSPPGSALRTLQTHVYHARKMLAGERVTEPGRDLLLTEAPGYRLQVDDTEVDALTMEGLVHRAQREFAARAWERAADLVERALELWRGPTLSNVPVGGVLLGRLGWLEELRIRVLELRIDIAGQLGRHKEHLPELRTLVADYPLHEWFHGQLITALYRSGRRIEALQAYQNLHAILQRELGVEPPAHLQRLRADILDRAGSDPALLWDRSGGAPARPERCRLMTSTTTGTGG